MAGGQQIDSATGTIGDARTVPLRSRKTGTGAATFQLTGIASAVGQGVLRQATAVLGQAITSAQQSMSASGLWWSSTPSVSIQEGSTTAVNLGSSVGGYNSFTDEFRVTPGYSLPSWLALTAGPGTGSGNLTPNGTQLDANDIPASPGIKIDVRRSGGAWVSSSAFGVTVTAAAQEYTEEAFSSIPLDYMFVNSNNPDTPPWGGSWNNASGAPWNWVIATSDAWPVKMGNTIIDRDIATLTGSGAYAAWVAGNVTKQTEESGSGWVQQSVPVYGHFSQWVVDKENFAIYYIPG